MRLNRLALAGLEAINYQKDMNWFDALTKEIKVAMGLTHPDDIRIYIKAGTLQALIKKHTGILVGGLTIVSDLNINAMVQVPILKKDNPILGKAREFAFSRAKLSRDAESALNDSTDRIGWVDLEKGKVGGLYAEIPIDLYLTTGLMRFATPEEISAVLCHELGHVFSYYECMHKTMTCNLALEAISKTLLGTNSVTENSMLLKRVEHQLDIKLPSINKLALEKNTNKLQTIAIDETLTAMRSSTKDGWLYDATAWEQAADQYVSRLGAGVHLARGLSKLHNANLAIYSSPLYLFLQAILNINSIFNLPFTIAMCVIFKLAGINSELNLYDDHNNRIQRIKNDVVARLTNRNLTKKETADIVTMVDAIEENKSTKKEPFLVNALVVKYILGDPKSRERERALEQLASNDLLVTAARYSALSV